LESKEYHPRRYIGLLIAIPLLLICVFMLWVAKTERGNFADFYYGLAIVTFLIIVYVVWLYQAGQPEIKIENDRLWVGPSCFVRDQIEFLAFKTEPVMAFHIVPLGAVRSFKLVVLNPSHKPIKKYRIMSPAYANYKEMVQHLLKWKQGR
jgi:hypothetical protein